MSDTFEVAKSDYPQHERHVCSTDALARFKQVMNAEPPPREAWGLIASPGDIYLMEGHWTLHNGEYAGPVFFCPWCGKKLESRG